MLLCSIACSPYSMKHLYFFLYYLFDATLAAFSSLLIVRKNVFFSYLSLYHIFHLQLYIQPSHYAYYTHSHTRTHTHTLSHTHSRTHTHTLSLTHTHTHTHTHIHTHTQACITFQGSIGLSSTKMIELANPTLRTAGYTVRIDGSSEFTTTVSRIIIPAESSVNVAVTLTPGMITHNFNT